MTEPDTDAVRLRVDGGVATITLCAPERGNRFTVGAMLALIEGLERAGEDEAAVLILRTSGPDFTFGRDQSERIPGFPRIDALRLILRANALLREFPGVSVALLRGHALGFGSGLALHCDITLAAADAVLGFDEVLHGLAPLVVVEYLSGYVGAKVAAELLTTGREVGAAEARELRMVNQVVDDDALDAEGEALVRRLSGQAPGALRLMKTFTLDAAAGRLRDPGEEAIARLDEWLAAGRPDMPALAGATPT